MDVQIVYVHENGQVEKQKCSPSAVSLQWLVDVLAVLELAVLGTVLIAWWPPYAPPGFNRCKTHSVK